jgi:plasmid maintenance system killer protein
MTDQVYIKFRNRKLEKCYLEQRIRERMWKGIVPRNYVRAIDLLKAVKHPSDLKAFRNFNYEPLIGDRKGQHSLAIGHRERLIFTVLTGGEVLIARIEEVSTTHYDH